jgi:hypothetical protein
MLKCSFPFNLDELYPEGFRIETKPGKKKAPARRKAGALVYE